MLSSARTRIVVVVAFAAWFAGALSYQGGLYGTGRAEVASEVFVILAASAALVFAAAHVSGDGSRICSVTCRRSVRCNGHFQSGTTH